MAAASMLGKVVLRIAARVQRSTDSKGIVQGFL